MPRKLIRSLFFAPRTSKEPGPLANVGVSTDAEFDWPPSVDAVEALEVLRVRADDGSEIRPVIVPAADVA